MVVEHSVTEVVLFWVLILVCLWCDLHAHQADKPVSARNAAIWSCIWVGLALVFAGYIGYSFGSEQVQLFLTGYLLEKSLSVDNLFVIMAIFSSFAVKDAFQHRVLYYGVLGALVLRLIFVAAGSSLVAMFACDSVPAIIAVTHDPFLVYTSNVFAILGLRSMYFLLAAGKRYLRHLEKSVVIILAYIGVKMLLDVVGIVHISPLISLGVVIGLLAIGILASLLPEKSAK